MIIAQEYNHLNAKEFLAYHHKATYKEIIDVIRSVDVEKHRTKVSGEKTMAGKMLYSPSEVNAEIKAELEKRGWVDT